jgi:hypothetical protein
VKKAYCLQIGKSMTRIHRYRNTKQKFCRCLMKCVYAISNYWWQRSDIWSQASYRYPISWEAFFDPTDSYFLFTEKRGYHKWALAHSSSCYIWYFTSCIIWSKSIKTKQVSKQEAGIWWVQNRFPRYGIPIWSLWPNIRYLSSIVA